MYEFGLVLVVLNVLAVILLCVTGNYVQAIANAVFAVYCFKRCVSMRKER